MKTYLDCIPCFFRQTLEAARMAGLNEEAQRDALIELGRMLPSLSPDATPPEIGYRIHRRIQELSGCRDPYRRVKEESNRGALALYPQLKERIHESDRPLRTAVELAILGNIIDYGALGATVWGELKRRLAEWESRRKDKSFIAFRRFEDALSQCRSLIYLGDNAGEVVFDRLLIEEIRRLYPRLALTYAVRHAPILNDAVIEDALFCGLDPIANVVSSGSKAPATVISECRPEFAASLRRADLIISKGQGNFEAMSDLRLPIYFLFVAKCAVVARDAGCGVGEVLLLPGRGTTA